MLLFYLVISFVVLQRLIELVIANKNAAWIKAKGGYEVGRNHYKYIVLLHIGFFVSFIWEVLYFQRGFAVWWWVPLVLFVTAQAGRVWSLLSLGRFWNTRIMVLPGAQVISKGPYRFLRHPNYLIVMMELMSLPLIFQAYWTFVIFTLLKAAVLSIRIPEEEKALREATNYHDIFEKYPRYIPKYDTEK